MAHNRHALAQRALKELRLIGEGQTASAGEMADALAAIDPLLSRLAWLNIYEPTNPFAFSNAIFQPLALLLAEDLAPSLAGRNRNELSVDRLQDQLRRICRTPLARNEMLVDRALADLAGAGAWQ